MTPRERQQRALATIEEAGIDLQNAKPDHRPRRWFAGPTSESIHGTEQLETVAYYVDLAYRNGVQAGRNAAVEAQR